MFFFSYFFVSVKIHDDLRESKTSQDDVPLELIVGSPHIVIRGQDVLFDACVDVALAHLKALDRPRSCIERVPFFRVKGICGFHLSDVNSQVTPVVIRERH